jgi:hypothetical protein
VKSGTSPNGVAYTNMPVLFTSWFSAARFTNWLQNGQQTNSSSMETGAYTLNNQTSGAIPARNAGAANYLPSRDEWYKAGFYNTTTYTMYPTNNIPAPTNTITNVSLANVANYGAAATPTISPINAGAYINTSSFYGAFDMFGNATEYTDTAGTGANAGRPQVFSGSWATALADSGLWSKTGAAIFRSAARLTGGVALRLQLGLDAVQLVAAQARRGHKVQPALRAARLLNLQHGLARVARVGVDRSLRTLHLMRQSNLSHLPTTLSNLSKHLQPLQLQ